MKSELTPQILWLYIGQPCHLENTSLVFSNDHNGVITPDNVIGHMNRECFIVPHLRRLENITNKDANALHNVFYGRDFSGVNLVKDWIMFKFQGESNLMQDAVGNPRAWLYLLSRGFDLFGLIDAGLAKEVSE